MGAAKRGRVVGGFGGDGEPGVGGWVQGAKTAEEVLLGFGSVIIVTALIAQADETCKRQAIAAAPAAAPMAGRPEGRGAERNPAATAQEAAANPGADDKMLGARRGRSQVPGSWLIPNPLL